VAFGDLDLNLLLALDALLQEQSVTKAAARLGLSQPSLSGSLARLRRHYDDELLVRVGGENQLTPLGQLLRLRTRDLVAEAQRLFETHASFDPATSDREFVISTSDYMVYRLMPAVSSLLRERAPHVRIRIVSVRDDEALPARDELRSRDFMIAPVNLLAETPHINLVKDRWVIIAAAGNTAISDSPTLDELALLPWVLTHHRHAQGAQSARPLRDLGIDPRAAVLSDSFLALPFLISQSDRIALIQEQIAKWLARVAGCRIIECPVKLPPHVEACWWHPLSESDLGHTWFRRLLVEAATMVDHPTIRPRTEDVPTLDDRGA
jgi:DNA-binding transcriptional LysR family regulator